MENQELSIQQVAALTGLSTHTLRYYEKIGLMEPIGRGPNGHRAYREGDLEWIFLLMKLRSTGMPIAQMLRFAELVRAGDAAVTERRELLEAHEQKLLLQKQELEETLVVLKNKITYYKAWEKERQVLGQKHRTTREEAELR